MGAADHLGAYADGWTIGDADKIIGALSDGYVLDDPNEGKVGKADFAGYLAGMKEAVASMRGEDYSGPFMELTEVTTREDGGVLTAWCWWSIPGTAFQGAGLIKVGNDGVHSEKLAFYTKLPE
ncbi:MAG: nuclear transport factor 2 family protein [Alphaproteobacteria bacterium]